MTEQVTYAVKWISDIPGTHTEDDAIELWAVYPDGKKIRVRSTNIKYHRGLRSTNNVPDTVDDVTFLAQGLGEILNKAGFDHLELAVAPMSPRKQKNKTENRHQVEFPARALDQGTTRGNVQ